MLKKALKRAGLPTAHGLYDLRHTYASIALSEGKPATYVAEQIGDSVATLLKWYAHWLPRRGADTTRGVSGTPVVPVVRDYRLGTLICQLSSPDVLHPAANNGQ